MSEEEDFQSRGTWLLMASAVAGQYGKAVTDIVACRVAGDNRNRAYIPRLFSRGRCRVRTEGVVICARKMA